MTNSNSVGWFDIHVSNLDRAKKFYETILGGKINIMPENPNMPPMKYGFLPFDMKKGVGGGIVEAKG